MAEYDNLLARLERANDPDSDSFIPGVGHLFGEAATCLRALQTENTELREKLVESIARHDAVESAVGDFGGPFHVEDGYDLALMIQWMDAMHTEEPDWERDTDPLFEVADELDDLIEARRKVLIARARREMIAYHGRVGDDWHPWWRQTPVSSYPLGEGQTQEAGSR